MNKNKTIPITDSDSSLDLLKPKTLKEKFRSSLGYLTKPNAPSRKVSKESPRKSSPLCYIQGGAR